MPLAVYVHVPFCRAKCPYCGFYSVPIGGQAVRRLLTAILTELDQRCDHQELSARTLYIGGGSPSCLANEDLFWLVEHLTERLGVPPEFTVEVNPGQVSPTLLEGLRQRGVNRLSLGAQSFQMAELQTLHRPYAPEAITQAVWAARQAGFANISLDMIFAIPGSTLSSWQANLRAALALGIEHISAYSLTYEAATPFEQRQLAGELQSVDEDTDRAMYEMTIATLTGAGWEHYEISNFARLGFACRHNLTYWANDPWLGLGPSAGSYVDGWRMTNVPDVAEYLAVVEAGQSPAIEREHPNPLETACETAVLNLRRIQGIDLAEYQTRTGYDARELFAEPIRRHIESGMMTQADGRLFLTPAALPVADGVLADFAGL